MEGRISLVRLLELGLDEVDISGEEKVRWPKKVGDQSMPDIDGVLAVYDVMDENSTTSMPKLLSESLNTLQLSLMRNCGLEFVMGAFDWMKESSNDTQSEEAYTTYLY